MEIATAKVEEIEEAKITDKRVKLAAFMELTKPRIAFMLVLTSAAGFYLGTEKSFDAMLFVISLIGILR